MSGKSVAEMKTDAPVATPLNLRQKLAKVRQTIRVIEKKGENKAQNYKFMRAEDVAGDIGDMLAGMNVVLGRENVRIDRTVIEVERVSNNKIRLAKDIHVILMIDYLFLDGDSNESIRVAAAGEGRDSGDKAVPKAFTSALKYALTQALMMRVGDDPEDESEHDRDKGQVKHDDILDDTPPTPAVRSPDEKTTIADRQELVAIASQVHKDGKAWIEKKLADRGIKTWGGLTIGVAQELINELGKDPSETFEGQQNGGV